MPAMLTFHAQGSAPEPYAITVTRDGHQVL